MIDAASPVSAGADTDADDIASGDVGVDDVIAVADEIIEDDARYVVTIRYLLAGIATLLFILYYNLLLRFVYEFCTDFSLVGFDMISSTFSFFDYFETTALTT